MGRRKLRAEFNIAGRCTDHPLGRAPHRCQASARSCEGVRSLGACAQNAAAVFVGDGPLLPRGCEAPPRAIHGFCTGWLTDRAKTAGLMAISSLFVLPSQHETWGAVVNEAMTAGLPVLASIAVGAAIDLIESEKQGVVFQTGRRVSADASD